MNIDLDSPIHTLFRAIHTVCKHDTRLQRYVPHPKAHTYCDLLRTILDDKYMSGKDPIDRLFEVAWFDKLKKKHRASDVSDFYDVLNYMGNLIDGCISDEEEHSDRDDATSDEDEESDYEDATSDEESDYDEEESDDEDDEETDPSWFPRMP
ncbi:hypothetical protein EBT25_17260 [bacterium]|nr:hypothetical protein [bacterium]